MNFWTWFSIFYVFASVTISQLLIEQKLRLIFLMIMFLLYVSIYNVYFSFTYYIKIRNEPGIKGERGDQGGGGDGGSDGVCAMAKSCGIASCRPLIVDTLLDNFPEYKGIRDKLANNEELSPKDKQLNTQLNEYINILIPQCESYEKTGNGGTDTIIEEFIKKIKATIKNKQ